LAEKVAGSAFVVAISSFGRSQLLRWVAPADRSKVQIVHCGLQADYARATPPVAGGEDRFACIGRLSEQKGHVVLIEAYRLLKARSIRPRLVLVGDGELRPDIERAIAEYGLQDQIELTGWGDEDAVRTAITGSRAMVLPSFAEGLPVVIMEAMALERPVITTYVAGIPELVRDGIDGLLVPAGDAAALADAIERVMAMDASQLAAMGQAARERVSERHSIETEAGKLAKLFEA
jgi:glycosyltransferase involved in cell wall biosynthesis